ncbi:MAG: hypothetical protein WCW40_12135 [Bacteroidota bacterium]
MKTRTMVGTILMSVIMILSAFADGKDNIQSYFNDTANKVKATENPVEKRALLHESFRSMITAVEYVQRSSSLSVNDRMGTDGLKTVLKEKQNELAGDKGFTRVPDEQLNDFADYVVQDLEQADIVISISLITLLLIVILVALIVR